ESFPCRRTEFVLHLLLHTRFSRRRRRLGRHRSFVVLLATDGDVRVHAQLLQPLDRFFAEVAGVGCVRNRCRRSVGSLRPLDPGRVQIVLRCLYYRHGLFLLIRRVRRFCRLDDLVFAISHRLSVVRIVESLVALLHDLRFGGGEVLLRLVCRGGIDGSRFLAPAFAAFGFTLGLFFITAALFFFRLDAGLRFQSRFRLADLGQPFFTSLQFRGQFVTTTASQRSVLLGVEFLGFLQQLLDFCFQPLDFLVHVAVTRGLVPRRVRPHLCPISG